MKHKVKSFFKFYIYTFTAIAHYLLINFFISIYKVDGVKELRLFLVLYLIFLVAVIITALIYNNSKFAIVEVPENENINDIIKYFNSLTNDEQNVLLEKLENINLSNIT